MELKSYDEVTVAPRRERLVLHLADVRGQFPCCGRKLHLRSEIPRGLKLILNIDNVSLNRVQAREFDKRMRFREVL
jgi:hypothetical protein